MLRPLSPVLAHTLLTTIEAISQRGYPRGVNEMENKVSCCAAFPSIRCIYGRGLRALLLFPPSIPLSLYWRYSAADREREGGAGGPSINDICKILHQPCIFTIIVWLGHWVTPLPLSADVSYGWTPIAEGESRHGLHFSLELALPSEVERGREGGCKCAPSPPWFSLFLMSSSAL